MATVTFNPKTQTVLVLTEKERGTLSEALRLMQEMTTDNWGDDTKLDPTLSRIQRKLGEEPHN